MTFGQFCLGGVVAALLAVAAPAPSRAQNMTLPEDLIAERLQGQACARFFSPGRLDRDLRFVAQMKGMRLRSTNSLTFTGDLSRISKHWTRLLGVSYGAAARGDQRAAQKIIGVLVDFAQSNAFLDGPSIGQARKSPCWDGGNAGSVCLWHVISGYTDTSIALIASAVVLEEHMTAAQKSVLDAYFKKLYRRLIAPMSAEFTRSEGIYGMGGDFGFGVLAYARWTRDARLAAKELRTRRGAFSRKIGVDGMIANNSYRGYRGYWYHTLGAEMALSYALVARRFGVDFFNDRKLGPKLRSLAIRTVNGNNDYAAFLAQSLTKRRDNAIRSKADEIPHMHQMAVNLPAMLRQEYGWRVRPAAAYRSKGKEETISQFSGFNVDCYYGSR